MADEIDIGTAASEVESVTIDGQTAANRPLPDLIAADKYTSNKSALTGTNSTGGRRSGWNALRPARVVPPGASGPGACQ